MFVFKYIYLENSLVAQFCLFLNTPPNCIIFYNAYILSELYEMHEKLGNTEILELIKKISPIAWRHINLNGRYDFSTIFEALNLMDILSKIVFDSKK